MSIKPSPNRLSSLPSRKYEFWFVKTFCHSGMKFNLPQYIDGTVGWSVIGESLQIVSVDNCTVFRLSKLLYLYAVYASVVI